MILVLYEDFLFEVVIFGLIQLCLYFYTIDFLGEICRIFKLNGSLIVQELVNKFLENGQFKAKDKFIFIIKFFGFVDIFQV